MRAAFAFDAWVGADMQLQAAGGYPEHQNRPRASACNCAHLPSSCTHAGPPPAQRLQHGLHLCGTSVQYLQPPHLQQMQGLRSNESRGKAGQMHRMPNCSCCAPCYGSTWGQPLQQAGLPDNAMPLSPNSRPLASPGPQVSADPVSRKSACRVRQAQHAHHVAWCSATIPSRHPSIQRRPSCPVQTAQRRQLCTMQTRQAGWATRARLILRIPLTCRLRCASRRSQSGSGASCRCRPSRRPAWH